MMRFWCKVARRFKGVGKVVQLVNVFKDQPRSFQNLQFNLWSAPPTVLQSGKVVELWQFNLKGQLIHLVCVWTWAKLLTPRF